MDMEKIWYIFGAGSYFGMARRPRDGDMVIAADGGLRVCRSEGIEPELVVGDFDSLGAVPDGVNCLRAPVDKDDTDMLLAVKLGFERGFKVFHLYAGTGGRLDHTLANLQTLIYVCENGGRAFLFDKGFAYTAVKNGRLSINGAEDGIFSVFCMSGRATGVCESNCRYPLNMAVLEPGFPIGVSNHFLSGPAEISVEDGTLVIGWESGEGYTEPEV